MYWERIRNISVGADSGKGQNEFGAEEQEKRRPGSREEHKPEQTRAPPVP